MPQGQGGPHKVKLSCLRPHKLGLVIQKAKTNNLRLLRPFIWENLARNAKCCFNSQARAHPNSSSLMHQVLTDTPAQNEVMRNNFAV